VGVNTIIGKTERITINMSIENKNIVLRLNAVWQVIGHCCVKEAIVAMNSSSDNEKPAALALDIGYNQKEDGSWDFENPTYMNPVTWEEWIELPIREFDLVIHTTKRSIRVPTVVIAANYAQMPKKHPRPTKKAIWERDGGKCQYTGQQLTKSTGNIDHVVPKDRGGKDSFENMVLCHKEVNAKKGNKLNSEIGLNLLKTPKAPLPTPVSSLIKEAKHVDWLHFITEKKG
jgi:5-methylcytosine-specific restriction endonuclease McrA